MGKSKGKQRTQDKYYRLAKEHGYRSRASWKLVQIDKKFSFLHSSRAVLDLCAAPGGWMQVALERVPVGSLVLGIDLARIAPLRGAISIEQDITRTECRARIKKIMAENGVTAFDLVLHDGSPNIGGAWSSEAVTQNSLVIESVKLATQFLAPKGTFVTKVFRSSDFASVMFCLNQLFEKVEQEKPAASRSTSAETFLVGLRYKAPAKIDPLLLDYKTLFQGSFQPKVVVDVLEPGKQKRQRGGYEDGVSIVRKVSSAADFIWSDSPLEVLGSVTSIAFEDPASLPMKDHSLTTEEVKALCEDLRVLGKQDFKHLLKWRMKLRKELSPSQKVTSTAAKGGEEKNEEDEDDRLLNEMEELTHAMEQKKKREKKIISKRRAKDRMRKATGMQIDALEDGYVDHELFSLSSIKGKKDLAAVDSTEFDDENGYLKDSDDEEDHEKIQGHSSSDLDSDEERSRYDEQMEELLDKAYESYMSKREGSTRQRKRARKAYSDQLLEGDDDGDIVAEDNDSDKNQADVEGNPLIVPLNDGEEPTQQDIKNIWFSQDIFSQAGDEGDLESNDSGDGMHLDSVGPKPAKQETARKNVSKESRHQLQVRKEEDDFEIVPTEAADSTDDSSSDESEDDYTKAEILACAKKMLRKKQREQMLDDAYTRYMFDDDGLPGWFLEEEKRHRQPIKPVTKEEVDAMRAQFKEINARPAKKVAEAKARKKRVAARRLEKVRKKANTISDQTDISDRSKGKMIEQLYKKATPQRPKKEYVVAKKGVTVKVGKGKVLVDRRMKKDLRGNGMGGKGGPKGGGGSKKGRSAKPQGGKGSAKPQGGGKGYAKPRGGGKGNAKPQGGRGNAKPSGRKGRKVK